MVTRFGDGRDWFFEKRFGLFIHWGLYAIPAWHEQTLYRKGMTRDQYVPLQQQFNPVCFDPDAWLDLAEEAGMQYVCFTTKHIDGFCMWDTAQTDYNVMHTPYGRDILGMLAEACHRRGFPLCLYYSIVDEHQPNYPNQGRSYELPAPAARDEPDQERYLAFVRAQVRELCTRYGEIHGFWWDANILGHRDPSVNAMIRELQPKAVINNRGFDEGDFGTPEREWDEEVRDLRSFERPIEACQSVGVESWGYKADEDYYSDLYLIQSLDKTLAKGGNYLLNVGPQADGTIPEESARILRTIGRWYHTVREAFDGVDPASHLIDEAALSPGDVLLTRRGNVLYAHLFRAPTRNRVLFKPLDILPRRVTLLNTGEPVEARVDFMPSQHREKRDYLRVRNLPVNQLTDTVLVLKLEFDDLSV